MLTTADKQIPVLLHDTDAGQPCLVCGEDCPGLEIHFWRKICINCKCPVSDHQAATNELITQVRRGKQLDENVRAQFECGNFSWIPPGITSEMVEEYMKQLPPEQRPVVGTVGEQFRRKLLMTQLPAHDHNPSDSLSPAQAEELVEFSRLRYELSYGVAEVRRVTEEQAEMFDCRTCQSPLLADQLAVFTERAGPACIWCVACFKCDVCEDPLVDLHYFYKDGELFCGRHHAELLKPRCAACDELILAKEYTLAEEKNWHIDHFCCWECDSPLGGQRYVTRDDHPFCILCYEELFAPPCKKCLLPIGLDSAHMVHRDYHWHATESCFYCENCQVSLITSPFLLKFEEIFCSSSCAQQYSVSQLACQPHNKVPQIEVIEDNPVDRNSIQSILRKDSSPTPPRENGLLPTNKRKVMFSVSKEAELKESEIKRSMSEEEFEYLEQSINEHYVQDSSPLSESSLSTSPLSEAEQPASPFAPVVDQDTSQNTSPFHTPEEGSNTEQDITTTNEMETAVTHIDEIASDTLQEVHSEEDEDIRTGIIDDIMSGIDEVLVGVEEKEEVVIPPVQQQDSVEAPETPKIVITSLNFPDSNDVFEPVNDTTPVNDRTPVNEVTSHNNDVMSHNNDVTSHNNNVTSQDTSSDPPDIGSEMTSVMSRWEKTKVVDPVDDKENDRPQRNRTRSDNEVDEVKAPKKPARGKLSSASFNRVLRKIDHTSNDSLFVERPGKRLKNRPRSMSSLGSHNRPQNTIEQKENLMSMYALAPDIADMVASVYKNQASINTTTHSAPDTNCQDPRTLGASPGPCTTDTPRSGLHKRNPSYEAAEFVMQLDVESEGEEGADQAGLAATKNVNQQSEDSGPITETPSGKSPKKGIRQRLSFKKKKDKNAVSPQKTPKKTPQKTPKKTPQKSPQKTPQKTPQTDPPDNSLVDKKRKKACVVM